EHGLGTRTVGIGDHAITGGLEGFAQALDIGIGPGIVGDCFANGFEGRLVDQGGHRIGAQRDTVELAVDLAAFELVGVECAEIADDVIKRGDGVTGRVFDDVAVVHLDDVGGGATGSLGGQLGPVIVPAQEFAV